MLAYLPISFFFFLFEVRCHMQISFVSQDWTLPRLMHVRYAEKLNKMHYVF